MADKIASWGDIEDKYQIHNSALYPSNVCPTKSEILDRPTIPTITIDGNYSDNQLVAVNNIKQGGIVLNLLEFTQMYVYTGSGTSYKLKQSVSIGNDKTVEWPRSSTGTTVICGSYPTGLTGNTPVFTATINGHSVTVSTSIPGNPQISTGGSWEDLKDNSWNTDIGGGMGSNFDEAFSDIIGPPSGGTIKPVSNKFYITVSPLYLSLNSTNEVILNYKASSTAVTETIKFTYKVVNGNSSGSGGSGTCSIRITNSSGQTLLSGAHLVVTTGISGGNDTIAIPINLSLNNTVSYKWTGGTANISGWINSSLGILKTANCSPSRYFSQCNGTMNVMLTNINAGIVNPDPDLGDTDLQPGLDDDIVANH